MKKALVFILGFLITGCVSQTAKRPSQDEMNKTVPVCASQKQCDTAWSATRQWINQNCGMKIQNYSADYIETYNSVGGDTKLACQVNRNTLPDGSSAILIRLSCGNMFGCIPDQYQSVINFNNYVSDAINKASPIKVGIITSMSDKNGKIVENPSYSTGLIIESVTPGGIASKSGVIANDILVNIGSDRIRTQYDITSAMEKYHSGDKVVFKVIRAGNEVNLDINL